MRQPAAARVDVRVLSRRPAPGTTPGVGWVRGDLVTGRASTTPSGTSPGSSTARPIPGRRTVLVAVPVYSVPHLIFHSTRPDGVDPSTAAVQTVGQSVLIALTVVLLVVAARVPPGGVSGR